MVDEADIARMEAHIAKVAAVGPKWEKAVDKLRKQFPDDLYAVHKRVKSMVSESKSRKTSVLDTSASASKSNSSKSSRKETKRPPTPPAITRGREDHARDITLTLPVKKKPLADLSDEMTKDQYPDSKSSSSTITSFTSRAEVDDNRFPVRDEEHISLDGIDLPQSWTLPDNLMSIYASIDKPVEEEPKKKEKECTPAINENPVPEMKKQPPNNTILDKSGDTNMRNDAGDEVSGVLPSGDTIMEPVAKKGSPVGVETNRDNPVRPVAAKGPSSSHKPVTDSTMLVSEISIPAAHVCQPGDVTMVPVETVNSPDSAIQNKPVAKAAQVDINIRGLKTAVDESGDTTMLPATAGEAANKTSVVSELQARAIAIDVLATKNGQQQDTKLPEAEGISIKVEQPTSGNTQPQFYNIDDIAISSLAIDTRIVAHLASTGLTSTAYFLLKGIREDDVRPIVDAIAKAEGVGIVDGVLAARRIEEAYHAFRQQAYSQKPWGAQ